LNRKQPVSLDERQYVPKPSVIRRLKPLKQNHFRGHDFRAISFHSPNCRFLTFQPA
jgi:hypothetical protein